MSVFKKILKYWITLSSMIGFLVGWVFVSQSSEAEFASGVNINTGTTQNQTVNLQPVPSLDSLVGGNPQQMTQQIQPFTIVQSAPSFFQPQMRTGGS